MKLVIGNGLIGRNLYYHLRKFGEVEMTSRNGSGIHIDLNGENWILPSCSEVYICAGETSTERCEKFPEETRKINVTNTIKLAGQLSDSFVVWVSSERVFDGSVPFRKVDDRACPTTEYGRQKAETEQILLDMGVTVVRFSKVIGYQVPLFEGWIYNLQKGLPVHPFSNMSMSPIPVDFATDTLWRIGKSQLKGLFQISADRDISYDRVTHYICNYMGKDLGLVQPIEAEISHPNTTLESNLNIEIPGAWETIQDWCRDRIYTGTR